MSCNGQQTVDSLRTSVRNASELDTATPCHRPSSTGARFIRFGPFQVDLKKGLVTKSGSRIRLTGKKYRVLVMLLEKAGEIVPRDAIYRDLWPNDTVLHKDFSLATIINSLRRVLEDSSFRPHYIETIPRRGFVFIAPLEVSHDSTLLAASVSLAPLKPRFFSIRRTVSLILIGIALGAMAVWISNHVRVGMALNSETTVREAKRAIN
jgi:DNA-binding winged helix-turn-helix (wHTH) protein